MPDISTLTAGPAAGPAGATIFRAAGKETARLVPHAGSKDLLLLFSTVGKASGNYWLFKQTEDLPVNRLYLSDMARTWYTAGIPGLGTDVASSCAALRDIATRTGCTRIFCVGQSMGGYGALLYGGLLMANGVLAFSTEAELMLPGSRSQRHAKQIAPEQEYARLAEAVKTYRGAATLIYGQFDIADLLGAAALSALMPRLQILEMPACTHNTPSFLLHRQLLRPALDSLIAGFYIDVPPASPKPTALDPGIREFGRRFQDQIALKDYAAALAQIQDFTPTASAQDWHAYWYATCLWRLKRFKEARSHLQPLLAKEPPSAATLGLHGKIVYRLGLKQEAVVFLERAIELDRTLIGEAADLARIYLSQGRFEDAAKRVATALKTDPKNTALQALLLKATKKEDGTTRSN